MKFFPVVDDPNYSFDLLFGEYNLRIRVYRAFFGRYVDVYDLKNKVMISAGKSILHGVDFFRYTKIKAMFVYLNASKIDPIDETSLLNGGFALEYPIQ